MEQKDNIPELRFPEFDGKWAKKRLEQVVRFSNGKAHEQNIDANGEVVVVNSKFISSEGEVRKYSNQLICKLHDHDIVMVMSDVPKGKALAKCMYIAKSENFSLNQRICALSECQGNYNKFLYFIINRNRYFLEFDSGVGQTNLRKQEVLDCPLKIPSLPEQQKIASFLSAVDEKIAQLQEKKSLLEDYKKGCMQKLFSQTLRFKDDDGNDYPDWEEKRLGDVSKVFSGGTPTSSNTSYYRGKIPFIGSGDIKNRKTEQYITEDALKFSSAKMINKGDLLYALYGATSGKTSISKFDGAINQAVLCIRSSEDRNFLYQYLDSHRDRIIAKFLQGGQGNLSGDIIKSLRILFPSIEEQQKIADFLSAIDEKIAHATTQLEQTKTFKKGLLQKMFV